MRLRVTDPALRAGLPIFLILLAGPAWANCSTVGLVTTCDASSVEVLNVGSGPFTPVGATLIVNPGAEIIAGNQNAVTYGSASSITIGAGARVENNATFGIGRWQRGYNTIEYGPNGYLVIETGAQVLATGTQVNAQAIDVIGGGTQVIVNRGLVSAAHSRAIQLEEQVAGDTNLVTNFGIIRAGDGASSVAFGTIGFGDTTFVNRTGGRVEGSFAFGDGNDLLKLEAGSVVTGLMDGGGGDNRLELAGGAGTSDTFAGNFVNFQTLAKTGAGRWSVDTDLDSAALAVLVEQGALTLDGNNSYGGATTVSAGVLNAGGVGAFSSGSAHSVAWGGILALNGYDQTVASLANGGAVALSANAASLPGTVLTVVGDYAGSGGILYINTTLGGDGSPTDMLQAASTSGSSFVHVTNVGGVGAITGEGIKIIDVTGASDGEFQLAGDFVTKSNEHAVVAGAYAYTLHKNGIADPADGDWYLRSQSTSPYNPGVGLYESYPQTLLELNGLPTLQQRLGNRLWSGEGNVGTAQGADPLAEAGLPFVQGRGLWGRFEAGYASFFPVFSSGKGTRDTSSFRMQAGADMALGEFDDGAMLLGGLSVHLARGHAELISENGDGSLNVTGYGAGASLSWFGASGFYVDAQAQYSGYSSDIRSDAAGQTLAKGSDATGYTVSLEAGRRFELEDGLSLTPQAQLVYSRVAFDAFDDVFGARVGLDDGDSLRGRVGVALNRERNWAAEDGTLSRSHLYGIANLHYEFFDGTAVSVSEGGVNAVAFANRNDRLWGGIGAGGTYSWNNDRYALHAEGQIDTSLNDFGDSYALKGTLGFTARW